MDYKNKIIEKFGNNYKIKGDAIWYNCPFHPNREDPTFNASISKGVYKCFSCGASGHIMKGVKSTTPYIYTPKAEEPTKEFKQVKPSNDGYFAFKKYIKTRQIDINIDDFNLSNKFSYYYDKGIHYVGLLVSDKARYTYYLNNDYTKKNKIWKKGSQATPFYFTHKDFKECKNLYIFEGFEDCLAFIELYNVDFTISKFCVIFGIGNVNKIDFRDLNVLYKFCVDNDDAGTSMVRNAIINNSNIKLTMVSPDSKVKDFNEELIFIKNNS